VAHKKNAHQHNNNKQHCQQSTMCRRQPYDCNVRLTLNPLDTHFSPIESSPVFMEILQRNSLKLQTPLPAAY
jgi:hypothetical protein